jgi:hypothetical protein
MAGLICNNYDVVNIQKYPFLYATKYNSNVATGGGNIAIDKMIYGEENSILPCEKFMNQIDFNKWIQK